MHLGLKKRQKKFRVDRTIFEMPLLANKKNIFALYVNFEKLSDFSVLQLKRSTLKSRLRKYITWWSFLREFSRKLSIYSLNIQYFKIVGFQLRMDNFLPNARRKLHHVIHFCNLLFSVLLLSYRTLKSEKISKLTYNANMFFYLPKVAFQKWFDRPDFFPVFSNLNA